MNLQANIAKAETHRPEDEPCALEAAGLECIRNDLILFSDLNFNLYPGETLQIHGANGSGKTSLLRILSGLALPTAGCVKWNGKNTQDSQADYLRDVNYIGHKNGIKSGLTPLENLVAAQALAVPRQDISPLQALEQMAIAELADIPVDKLSSGQRRRVALSRLLITPACLWILDEPFTALDKTGKQLVNTMLKTHVQEQGITIIVAHDHIDIPEQQLAMIQL